MEHALPYMDGGRTPRVGCNRFNIQERNASLFFVRLSDENAYYLRSQFSYFLSYLLFSLPHPWIGPTPLMKFSFRDMSQNQEVFNNA